MSRFRDNATTEAMSRPTYLYFPSKAGHLSYTKTALWLATLERYLGWETLQPIMADTVSDAERLVLEIDQLRRQHEAAATEAHTASTRCFRTVAQSGSRETRRLLAEETESPPSRQA